jgi:putative DNA primase/helicase
MKKEFFAVGETDSAKTTALNLIRLFLGSQNTASVSLQELESDRFAAADLFGKLANIHADLDSAELKRTSRFKTVTGRDQIRAQRKNGQPFHFVPYAKHFYSANKIPETKDESDAFFNRFDIVEFPFRFVSDPSQYTEIDGKIRSGFKLKDEKVLDKLLTPEGKSGILKVLVARVGRIVESNGIPSSMSDVEARDLWLYHSDFIENFLKDMAKFDPEARTSKADLYAAYCAYCIRHKQVPKSKTALNVRVERHGAQETVDKVEGRSVKRWKGIKLGGEKSVEPVTPLDSTVSTRNSPPASKHKLTNPGISDQELATANQALGNWEWAIR